MKRVNLSDRLSFVRLAGRETVYIPVSSAARLMTKGLKVVRENGPLMLLEPGHTPLPGGLVVVATLVKSERHILYFLSRSQTCLMWMFG